MLLKALKKYKSIFNYSVILSLFHLLTESALGVKFKFAIHW